MSRLLRSMSGQLLALLLLAMVLSHLIAVLVVTQLGSTAEVHPVAIRGIEAGLLPAYRLSARDPQAARSLLADFTISASQFDLIPDARIDAAAMDAQEAALAAHFGERLGLPAGTHVRTRLTQVATHDAPPVPASPWLYRNDPVPWALDVDAALPNGEWLHSRYWPTMMHPHWERVLAFSLPVSVVPIILIAMLFGRRIMRPLRALANAARRISRGERAVLPLKGPDGVREITQAFNEMQERLDRFISDRTRMIAAIGHDLRTPLASLRIRAELIEDDGLRDAMVQTLDEMSVMAEETLRFAREDAAREPTQTVDISALVGEVVAQHRMLGHAIDWVPPAPILYPCRPVHLKRAVANLLDNAVWHGHATVRIEPEGTGKALVIAVEDDGPGLDEDWLERAFEPFSRRDAARSQEHGGAGLGLAIARSCVRAHGGDVHLHNRPEGGLRAVITLPR